jgi:Spy/CpxP family protein refolding chaperone
MQYSFIKYAGLATITAGIAFAQAAADNSQPGTPTTQEEKRPNLTSHLEHMAQALNLTDSQRERARIIFQNARQSAQPIQQELRENREKLTAAAKAGKSEDEIQKLADEQGRLLGQLVAIRTQSSAKFYQLLTPEQRMKADQMHEQFRQNMRSRAHSGGL